MLSRALPKLILIAAVAVLSGASAFAQVGTRVLHHGDQSSTNAIHTTPDGGVILTGTGYHLGTVTSGAWRFGPNLREDWQRFYTADGDYNLLGSAVHPLSGRIAACGDYIPSGVLHHAFVTVSDPDGNTLWTRQYSQWEGNTFDQIVPLDDGGWLVAGRRNYDEIIVLLRLDEDGNTAWSREEPFAFGTIAFLHDLQPFNDGWVGFSHGIGDNPVVIEFGADGTIVDTTFYLTNDDIYLLGGYPDGQGGWLFCGRLGFVPGVVRGDGDGNVLWERSFPAYNMGLLRDILVTADGDWVAVGSEGNGYGGDGLRVSGTLAGQVDDTLIPAPHNGLSLWSALERAPGELLYAGISYPENSSNYRDGILVTDGVTVGPPQVSVHLRHPWTYPRYIPVDGGVFGFNMRVYNPLDSPQTVPYELVLEFPGGGTASWGGMSLTIEPGQYLTHTVSHHVGSGLPAGNYTVRVLMGNDPDDPLTDGSVVFKVQE